MNDEIKKIKVESENVSDFLINITDKNKYTAEQIYNNLQDCLRGHDCNIYSCGPSFKDLHKELPVNENTIKICIKSAENGIEDSDIFVFDNRISSSRHRGDYKYNIENKFSIYWGEKYFSSTPDDTGFLDYIKGLPAVLEYPSDEKQFLEPNMVFTPDDRFEKGGIFIEPCDVELISDIGRNVYYGRYNVFVPVHYRIMLLMNHMGIKKFNVVGVDIANVDLDRKSYLDHLYWNSTDDEKLFHTHHPTMGTDTLLNLWYENIMDYSLFDITLYSDHSNANVLVPRYKDINLKEYHCLYKFKSVDLKDLLSDISLTENQILFLQMIEYVLINNIEVVRPTDNNGVVRPVDSEHKNIEGIIKFLADNNFKKSFLNIVRVFGFTTLGPLTT